MYIVSLRLHTAAAARQRRRAAAMSTAAALRSPLQMWQQRFWSVPFHVWRFWSIGTDSARDPVVSCPYQQQPPPPLLMLPPACLPQPACHTACHTACLPFYCSGPEENHQRADARKTSSREEVDFRRSTHRDLGICVPSKMGLFLARAQFPSFLTKPQL